MARPVVFISHSTRDPGDAQRITTLTDALETLELTVRVDKDALVLGELYRRQINEWISECRAAIIVIAPETLESEEVKAEASVLAYKKSSTPDFTLIPVLAGATSYDDLKRPDWLLYGLSEQEALRWPEGLPVPKRLMERLEDMIALFPGDSMRDRFERNVAGLLKQVDRYALDAAAQRLGLTNFDRWPSDDARRLIFARRLLDSRFDEQIDALELIADVDGPGAAAVLKSTVPYGWIDEISAAVLNSVTSAPHGRRGVGLNTEEVDTCRMYVQRAAWRARHGEVEGGTSDLEVDELLGRARDALKRALFGTDRVSDDELQAALADDDRPHFLLMPPPSPEALARIRERFPSPALVMRCGDETPEEFARRSLPDVIYLEPPVDRELEQSVAAAKRKALTTWGIPAAAG
jgi:hypothetical protein